MSAQNSTLDHPILNWKVGVALMVVMIGGLEVYRHATWGTPGDITLQDGTTVHGRVRWGWHNEVHILTNGREMVVPDIRMISWPLSNSAKAFIAKRTEQ